MTVASTVFVELRRPRSPSRGQTKLPLDLGAFQKKQALNTLFMLVTQSIKKLPPCRRAARDTCFHHLLTFFCRELRFRLRL